MHNKTVLLYQALLFGEIHLGKNYAFSAFDLHYMI
jgi:hypothetical protein